MLPLAELTLEGIGAGAIGAGVIAVVLFFAIAERLAAGRKLAAEELRREMAAGDVPQRVEIQSPLSVTPHVEFTPLTEHERLVQDFRDHRDDVDRRFQAMSDASSASRQKIYDLIRTQGEKNDLALKAETARLHDRLDSVPARTIELLKTTRDLHAK